MVERTLDGHRKKAVVISVQLPTNIGTLFFILFLIFILFFFFPLASGDCCCCALLSNRCRTARQHFRLWLGKIIGSLFSLSTCSMVVGEKRERERERGSVRLPLGQRLSRQVHIHEMLIVLSTQGKGEGEDYGTRCLTRTWPNATTTATVLLTIPPPPVWHIERL